MPDPIGARAVADRLVPHGLVGCCVAAVEDAGARAGGDQVREGRVRGGDVVDPGLKVWGGGERADAVGDEKGVQVEVCGRGQGVGGHDGLREGGVV